MKNAFIICLFGLFLPGFQTPLFAQCLPADPCIDAAGCVFTESMLEGTLWSNYNMPYTGNTVPGFCGTMESDMWFQIVPDSHIISITLQNMNCLVGNGLQLALYPSCNTTPVACNGGSAGGAFMDLNLTTYVTPGLPYLLVVDGYAGDQCDFTLETTGVSVQTSVGEIIGRVLIDQNADCLPDSINQPVANIPVQLDGQYQLTYPSTADGAFYFVYSDTGAVTISAGDLPAHLNYWSVCQDEFTVDTDSFPNTTNVTFLLQPQVFCPNLQVELGLPPFFRPCWKVPAKVRYWNYGTVPAEDAYLQVIIPSVLSIDPAILSYAVQSGDTLTFALGDVPPFHSGMFEILLTPPCDGSLLGQTLCLDAYIYPDSVCGQNANWSGARVEVSVACAGDTIVQFTLKNNGSAPTAPTLQYTIIENEAVQTTGIFSLAAGQSMLLEESANGATWRLEADQEPGHPGLSMPAVSLEGCGGLTPGQVNAFRRDDADDFVDQECREVIGSYDPNLKTASPAGAGDDHLIHPNTPLEYVIHFQNTGTDTAFQVLLRDVFPPELDPLTFRAGTSSHPCTWKILGLDTLEVLFRPVFLPDSNVNEPASHGWFEFAIEQKKNLPAGTLIENRAAIFFDYNDPVITDPAWHRVDNVLVRTEEQSQGRSLWRVLGNPTSEICVFEAVAGSSGNARFELRDAAGRLLRTHNFTGPRFEFHRNNLPGGLYFYQIAAGGGAVFSGKIVIQGR